jgi:hypothetical protein
VKRLTLAGIVTLAFLGAALLTAPEASAKGSKIAGCKACPPHTYLGPNCACIPIGN